MANTEPERETYRCTLCDEPVTKRGQYGHIKFTDGEGHGPNGETPKDADKYFIRVKPEDSEENEGNSDDDSEGSQEPKDREGNGGDSSGSQSAESSDTDTSKSGNANTSDGTETAEETDDKRTLRDYLTTPVNELL